MGGVLFGGNCLQCECNDHANECDAEGICLVSFIKSIDKTISFICLICFSVYVIKFLCLCHHGYQIKHLSVLGL